MSSRRKSGRASGTVSYAETVAQLDDDDEEEVELDEETAAAKKKRVNDELKKERLSARKRESDDVDYGKAPKKAKNAKAKKKAFKDAGKLSNIIDMPSDILAMIFSSLDPLDLLKLSRTNKMLHHFLREQTSIWIQCRQNLVLWIPKANVSHADSDDDEEHIEQYEPLYVPSKPPNLTESAWTRLLFDKSCFACGSTKKRMYENYRLQIRSCLGCWPGRLLQRKQIITLLEEQLGKKKVELAVFDILPESNDAYYVDAVKAAHEHLVKRKKEMKKKEYEEWLQTKKVDMEAIQVKADEVTTYLAAFATYGKDEVRRKWREKYQLRYRRSSAITDRVLAEEWGNEDYLDAYLRNGSGRKLLEKGQEFTGLEWQTLRPKLQAEMAARREFAAKFVIHKAKRSLRNWLYSTYWHDIEIPTTSSDFPLCEGDLLGLSGVLPILDLKLPTVAYRSECRNDEDALEELNVFERRRDELWQEAKPKVIEQVYERKIEILSDLCAKIHAATASFTAILAQVDEEKADLPKKRIKAMEAALNNVRAVFSCSTCSFENDSVALSYNEISEHSHFTTTPECRDYDAARSSRPPHSWQTVQIASPWRFDLVGVNDEIKFALKTMLDRCTALKHEVEDDCDAVAVEYAIPQTISDKNDWDKRWRFVCNADSRCNMKWAGGYDHSKNKAVRKWDAMLSHLAAHYAKAQRLEEILVKPSAIEITTIPEPVAAPAALLDKELLMFPMANMPED